MKVMKQDGNLVMSAAIVRELAELLEKGTPAQREKAATYLRKHLEGEEANL